MDKSEYFRIMGLSSIDVGSKTLLLKKVVELAKKKGYRTANFYKMPIKQLKAVFNSLK